MKCAFESTSGSIEAFYTELIFIKITNTLDSIEIKIKEHIYTMKDLLKGFDIDARVINLKSSFRSNCSPFSNQLLNHLGNLFQQIHNTFKQFPKLLIHSPK